MIHTEGEPEQGRPSDSASGSDASHFHVSFRALKDSVKASAASIAAEPTSNRANPFEDTSEFFDSTKKAEKQRGRKFRNDRLQQDMDLREKHAEKAVRLAEVAVACWIFLFAVAGVTNTAIGRPFLGERELMTLTAGATVNVIAVFLVVVKGLFPPPRPQTKAKKAKKRKRKKESMSAENRS